MLLGSHCSEWSNGEFIGHCWRIWKRNCYGTVKWAFHAVLIYMYSMRNAAFHNLLSCVLLIRSMVCPYWLPHSATGLSGGPTVQKSWSLPTFMVLSNKSCCRKHLWLHIRYRSLERFWHFPIIDLMGPFRLRTHGHPAGGRAKCWDIQNKPTSTSLAWLSFVLNVPEQSLPSNMADFVSRDRRGSRNVLSCFVGLFNITSDCS